MVLLFLVNGYIWALVQISAKICFTFGFQIEAKLFEKYCFG